MSSTDFHVVGLFPRRTASSLSFPLLTLLEVLCSVPVSRADPLMVWGANYSGQTNIPANATNVVALAAGDSHCLALRADGIVVAWGGNYDGQAQVPADLTNAVSIAAGSTHSLALRSNGTVAIWGRIFGSGVNTVPQEATNVVGLALGPGAEHALVLRADGTVLDWGGNDYYGLTQVPPTARGVVAVASGAVHSVALRSDGKVVAWGGNSMGQLAVPVGATNIVAIATGWYDNAAIRADGTLLTWGASAPSPSYGFTNLADIACVGDWPSFGNEFLAARRDGTIAEYSAGPPVYPTNQIAAVAAGSFNLLALVGSGPPVFVGNAVNRTVASGLNAYFHMHAVGALPIVYQWTCDGTNLPGATNLTLVLNKVQPGIAGTYYLLIASNALGMATSGPMALNEVPLEIAVQPQATVVLPGTNVTFLGTAIGQGPFSYQWQFNGTNLEGATTSSLSLTNVQLNQSGVYSLVVSNSFGVATNNEGVLNVAPLLITVQPPSQQVLAGTNATFTATATGQGPFGYQWEFNRTNLDGATNSSLALTNVQMYQAGRYSVVGSNQLGTTVSGMATLTVVPLTITSQPQNQTVPLGTNATFALAVNSLAPVTYQWQYNGANLVGSTNNPLILMNVQQGQAGSYSVIVSNSFGAVASSSATLSVIPLIIATQPQSQVGFLGLSASFTVVPSFQGPFIYQWSFNGSNIEGATDSRLVLTNLQLDQAGVYSVLVSNQYAGVQSADAALSVSQVANWGSNAYGQTNVPPGLTNAIAVSGNAHSVALRADGTVVAWGSNQYGQTNVPPDLTNAVAIAAGYTHTLALRTGGTVSVWGNYFDGLNYFPAVPPSGLTNIVAIAAGWYHALALRADGTMVAWGYGYYGQTNVPATLTNVVAIAAGGFYSLALKSDGTVVGWGGQGRSETNFPPGLSNVIAIAAGAFHGLALKSDGTVVGWGDNSDGEINVPVGLSNVVAISAGVSFSLALKADGTMVVWGGQGLGETNVPPNLTSAVTMAGGNGDGLALPGVPEPTGRISNPVWTADGLRFSLPTQSGRVYQLEYKSSLLDSNWVPLMLFAGNGGMLTLSAAMNLNFSGFYRVHRW